MSEICAFNSNPTPGVNDGQSGAFNQYMWGDLVFMTNLFNASANGGPNGVSACFDLPIDGGPNSLPDNSGCYSTNGITAEQPCIFSFTGQNSNTSGGVRGYPAAILGSRGGCHETWGVACGLTPILMAGTRDNGCPIYDLNVAQAATGYPAMSNAIPQSNIILDWSDCGAPGTYNVFTDTYWHNVTDTSLLPVDANGNPITALQNTINGMSVRDTAMWNLNVWYGHPDLNQITTFTGGTQVTTNPVTIGGCPGHFVVKHETGGQNNFFYLAFVLTPSKNMVNFDYSALAAYVQSPAFITTVYNHPASQAICQQMANPTNGALPKTCRPPDGTFAVDSLQTGIEMWGTDTNAETAVCFDQLGFMVGDRSFGKLDDTIIVEPPEECIVSQSVFFLTDETTGGCIDVPFSLNCGGCDCEKPTFELKSGNPSCCKVGDTYTYIVRGCECEECGAVGWYPKSSFQHPVCMTYNDPTCGGLTTLTIGPIKSCQKMGIGFGCLPLDDCQVDPVTEQIVCDKVEEHFLQAALALTAIKAGQTISISNGPVEPVDALISRKTIEPLQILTGLK